ncbi:AAA family ATPase [Noviherbaspirillum pedocola]|uniref:AAA family ATPase n=1 Tax=Noviherbaspirillum pedocola TaxID=2801341 RepID=A0A934SY95_9BURK|nr:AAA family ATPase [Noviherbaspirillum pedocola]MBK4737778.1 AAA family ATPase [Noviherbaspirillum pedocola]
MPAKIIAVFNQKGGCAKTMTTMQLGGAFGLMGYNTLIVDMDPQGTAAIWSSQAEVDTPFPANVISLAPMRELMIKELKKFVRDYDVILIDCPPAIDSPIPWAALQVADIGIIPVIPVLDNVWASVKAKELAARAQRENTGLQTYFLISQMRRGNIFAACLEQIKNDPDVPLLEAVISLRNAYPESQAFGTTVQGLSKSSEASKEVRKLAKEIIEKLQMQGA